MAALAESYPESMFEDDFDDSELGQSAISLHQSAMDVDQKQEERATTPTPATNSSKSTPRKKPRKIKILSPRKTPVKSTNMPTTPDARSRNDSEPAEEKLKVEEHDEEARDEEEQHSTPANPGQQIDQFDWDGLFNEFDKKMDEFGEDEEALYQEFDHLMKVWPRAHVSSPIWKLTLCIPVFHDLARDRDPPRS